MFSPAAAWIRASMFFCACFIVSWLTGTQALILNTPIATATQMQDAAWISWTLGLVILILAGYWDVWAQYTMRFKRKLFLAAQIPFGVLWGVSMGQLMLVIWHRVSSPKASVSIRPCLCRRLRVHRSRE